MQKVLSYDDNNIDNDEDDDDDCLNNAALVQRWNHGCSRESWKQELE